MDRLLPTGAAASGEFSPWTPGSSPGQALKQVQGDEACGAGIGHRIVIEALALVGTRFRHGGHDPASGLDCVGLVAAAHRRAGVDVGPLPDRYRWREAGAEQISAALAHAGLVPVIDAVPGDVLVRAMPGGQLHLLIAGDGLVVHAHAGLRRVVAMPVAGPGDGPGELVARWRKLAPTLLGRGGGGLCPNGTALRLKYPTPTPPQEGRGLSET